MFSDLLKHALDAWAGRFRYALSAVRLMCPPGSDNRPDATRNLRQTEPLATPALRPTRFAHRSSLDNDEAALGARLG
jgi:hypothetical protein